jgi:hypothetical protein
VARQNIMTTGADKEVCYFMVNRKEGGSWGGQRERGRKEERKRRKRSLL